MPDVAMMERVLCDPASIPDAAQHPDWEVRYTAAVAIEALADPAWLPTVLAMWRRELARPDYARASVRFVEHVGDRQITKRCRGKTAHRRIVSMIFPGL